MVTDKPRERRLWATVIYLDTLFFTELAADFMLLLAADRFCAAGASWKRLAAGAGVGALYSVLYVLFEGAFAAVLMKGVFAALMLLAAFGRRNMGRCAAVFLLCSAAFAGIVLAVSVCCGGFGSRQLIFSFAAAYALMGGILRFRAARGGGTVKVKLENRGRSVTLTALRDTGCVLRDPATGGAVLIAEEEALLPLLDEKLQGALGESSGESAEKRLEKLWARGLGRGFRLLPYISVGTEDGLLLAFSPEAVSVGGRELKGISAALSPGRLSCGEFSAIINADGGGRI